MATAAYELTKRTQTPRFSCNLAHNRAQLEASYRLRYKVFVEEMGADIEDGSDGMEYDALDAHCRHLLVWDNSTGVLAASTRILGQEQTGAAGGFYSGSEFDISRVLMLPGCFMEIGRTCVRAEYRRGTVIAVLWSGISEMIASGGYRHLIGCASIGLEVGVERGHAIFAQLEDYLSPENLRVTPRLPLPEAGDRQAGDRLRLPPLLKAYIGLGARVGGPPCWDPAFKVADLFMHLQLNELSPRYARHFLQRSPGPKPRPHPALG